MQKFFQHPVRGIFLAALLCIFVFLSACKHHVKDAETEERQPVSGKLLVLPFRNLSELYGKNKNARCPICGKVFITGEVSGGATGFLSDELMSMLRQGKYYKKVVASESQWGAADLMSESNRSLTEFELLLAAGRAASADALMVGYLYRFQQRIGSRISVESPASVAFGIHLIDVKTGRQLWEGHFDETQRSLSENLFKLDTFIKRKASWITAEEMAVSGLKEMLRTLSVK